MIGTIGLLVQVDKGTGMCGVKVSETVGR